MVPAMPSTSAVLTQLVLFLVAIWAGAQNALAGGGSFVTFPALLLAGMDARAANITSTIALFPGQLTTGWAGRSRVSGAGGLGFAALAGISLAGGVVGAVLLLETPPSFFARLVPWLVLFATAVFAWGSFRRRPAVAGAAPAVAMPGVPAPLGASGAAALAGTDGVPVAPPAASPAPPVALNPLRAGVVQFGIAIYGGYFGGGIGILMLAALTLAGLAVREAGATKNVLAAAMNASAVLVFVFSPDVRWGSAVAVAIGAILGGQIGAWMLLRVNERALRVGIVLLGVLLTVGLFTRLP